MSLRAFCERATLNAKILLYLRHLLREASFTADEIASLQLKRLKRLLVHAHENFEFYRHRFEDSKFDPYRFSDVEQLRELPVLTKSEYRRLTTSIYSANPLAYESLYKDRTSGSTGTPLRIYRTWDERAYMVAKWLRALYFNGYRWNDTTFSLPSPHRLQRDSIMQRFGILKRHSVAYTAPVEIMVSEYRRVRPSVLYGNKSQLVEMARYCAKNAIRLPHPRFSVCGGETLDAGSRNMIAHAFGPNIAEAYGAVEFSTLAWQVIGNDCFNFSHTTDVLELVSDESPDENCGNCIITDLYIRSFPLIRYQLGDYLETSIADGVRRVSRIRGRLNDWVIFKDGTRKPFHPFWKLVERRPEIMQFRIIQESVDVIRIVLVKDASASRSELEGAILHDLRKDIRDGDIAYRIEWVDEIRPEPNGKIRVLISNVQENVRQA